jgi:hypothetical protein
MKKYIIFLALCFSVFMCEISSAQKNVTINIEHQPMWGPVGYNYVEYYYIPEVESYYHVPKQQFIYLMNGHWVRKSSLPRLYRGYDMFSATKFVLNEPKPYLNHHVYKEKYKVVRGQGKQHSIRDSHDAKYFGNRHHPEHSKWKANNKYKKRKH